MRIRDWFTQIKTVAVTAAGFVKETSRKVHAVAVKVVDFITSHPRRSIAVVVALLIAGPLLTGAGGESFFFNLAGLGVIVLVVRRIVRVNDRRKAAQARRANCRCPCHRQGRRSSKQATQQTQQQGGTP